MLARWLHPAAPYLKPNPGFVRGIAGEPTERRTGRVSPTNGSNRWKKKASRLRGLSPDGSREPVGGLLGATLGATQP